MLYVHNTDSIGPDKHFPITMLTGHTLVYMTIRGVY